MILYFEIEPQGLHLCSPSADILTAHERDNNTHVTEIITSPGYKVKIK